MSAQARRLERVRRLRELQARRAAIEQEIRILDHKLAELCSLAVRLRRIY